MLIQPYKKEYFNACLKVFEGNIGKYFGEWERDDFAEFLEQYGEKLPYFVIIVDEQIVACGGYEQEQDGITLTWGMVDRALHGQGIGRALTAYRLNRIAKEFKDWPINIDTSQHTQGFYEQVGFAVTHTEPDGYQAGMDKVLMTYRPSSNQ